MYAVYDLANALTEEGPIYRAMPAVTGPIRFERGENGSFPKTDTVADFSYRDVRAETRTLTFADIKSAQLFAAAVGGSAIVDLAGKLHDDHAMLFAGVVRNMIEDMKINALEEFDDGASIFDVVFDGATGYSNKIVVVVNNPKTSEVVDVIYCVYNDNYWTESPKYYYDFEDSVTNDLLTGEFYADEADEDDFEDEEDDFEDEEGNDDDSGFEPHVVTESEPTQTGPVMPAPFAITDDQKAALERVTAAAVAQFSSAIAEVLARMTAK